MKRIIITIITGLVAPSLYAQDKERTSEKPILCRGNYQTELEAIEQLGRLAATYTDLNQWKDRAAKIRKQILVGANLDPLPKRTPLNAVVHKKREYDGYSVESVAFEARPGFLVYGNLYRPRDAKGPRPIILFHMDTLVVPKGVVTALSNNIVVLRLRKWAPWFFRMT